MMMKTHFTNALENLENMLSDAASKAEHAVHSAVSAIENDSQESAYMVVQNDREIDDAEIAIEEECLKILALYQPVASDLRRVVTMLKVNNEIERIGDLAVNIAERAMDMTFCGENAIEKIDFGDMVSKACSMLSDSLDSLSYRDSMKALEVTGRDDAVDAIHRDNYKVVRELIVRHPSGARYYMNCLTVSRCLERIADIATNIAEDVVYLESGNIIRHRHEGEDNGK